MHLVTSFYINYIFICPNVKFRNVLCFSNIKKNMCLQKKTVHFALFYYFCDEIHKNEQMLTGSLL
jgi:hypothetical protein